MLDEGCGSLPKPYRRQLYLPERRQAELVAKAPGGRLRQLPLHKDVNFSRLIVLDNYDRTALFLFRLESAT
jgi:hypothetical protein